MRDNFLNENIEKIKSIQLTDEEKEAALFEGQVKKYFHEKQGDYWLAKESDKHKEFISKQVKI
jgi:hypothetical protein